MFTLALLTKLGHRIPLVDVREDIVKCFHRTLAALLLPKKFIQITWQAVAIHPIHSLQLLLQLFPQPFNMICSCARHWIHKIILCRLVAPMRRKIWNYIDLLIIIPCVNFAIWSVILSRKSSNFPGPLHLFPQQGSALYPLGSLQLPQTPSYVPTLALRAHF